MPKKSYEIGHSIRQEQGYLRPPSATAESQSRIQVGGRLANRWIIKNNRPSINYFRNSILTRFPDTELANEYINFMIDEINTQPEDHYYLMELNDNGDWLTGGAPKISNLINNDEEYILISENLSGGKSTKKHKKYRKKTRKKRGGFHLITIGLLAALYKGKKKKKRKKKTRKKK
jgi:hypothetical protein